MCVCVSLCYGNKSQIQKRICTGEALASELETSSLPAEGGCRATKGLLGGLRNVDSLPRDSSSVSCQVCVEGPRESTNSGQAKYISSPLTGEESKR